MNEQVDSRLREALRDLQPPPVDESQRERVHAAVRAAAEEDDRKAGRLLPTWLLRRRPAVRLGLAVAAAAVVIGAALLFGLPKTSGPENVSAADILQRTLIATSSGRTFQATVELRYTVWDMWADTQETVVERWRVAQRADGSYRTSLIHRTGKGQEPLVDEAYDSGTGTVRELWLTRGLVEHRNAAPGPPDRVPGALSADISALARALAAEGGAVVESTTYDPATGRTGVGRSAWLITCSLAAGPSRPGLDSGGSIVTLTIDKETSLPLRYQASMGGIVLVEVRNDDVVVNEPLPLDALRVDPPAQVDRRKVDDGFRPVDLTDAAALKGYVPVQPDVVPAGYSLRDVRVARSSTTANRFIKGRHVFALDYRRGFDYLTLTTRRVDDPAYVVDTDPFDVTPSWSKMMRHEVRLASGLFEGATAMVVVTPMSMSPHLWVVKDGVLLTVGGGASADELVAVAESVRAIEP